MHVMETGDEKGLAVLLLHGNPTWGFLYRKVMAELSAQPFRLIAPDLLGLGFSDRPAQTRLHTLTNHAAWMGELIESLGLERLIFVGQDWGGPIGLRALAERPGLTSGLVLLNTVAGPPKPGFRPAPFHRFARLPFISDVAFRLLGFPQSILHRVQGDRESIRGNIARAYRYPLRGVRRNAAPLALARMVPDSHRHASIGALSVCQEFVSSWKGPAAIVWGDRDPILGRVRTHIERLLPQARVTRTNAGHFLQEEVPHEIAAAIREVARDAQSVLGRSVPR